MPSKKPSGKKGKKNKNAPPVAGNQTSIPAPKQGKKKGGK